MNVTIVGGGLTGLTAAYYLGHAKPEWNITLYEQAPDRKSTRLNSSH